MCVFALAKTYILTAACVPDVLPAHIVAGKLYDVLPAHIVARKLYDVLPAHTVAGMAGKVEPETVAGKL